MDQPTAIIPSPDKFSRWPLILVSSFAIFSLAASGWIFYQNLQLQKQIASLQTTASPTPSPITKNEVLAFQINTCCSCPTKVPLSLIGTDGWVVYEKGKNYSEYLPEKCDRVDCQPCPPLEEENQGKTNCKDPRRPAVCTMECIQNPPYICGSDGKSYCSVCQACSNSEVDWYEMKNEPCP